MDGEPLHRLRGERCEQCGSRRYYLQEGFRYCENGHQLEGVQYMDDETGGVIPGAQTTHKKKAATDEEDAGDIGNDGYESTTASGGERRSDSDSEASRKKAGRPRKLKGNAARELYLECLQLILRHQIWHLVKVRNCPDNIEGIARALWSLRVRDCPNLRPRAFAGDRLYESDSDRGRWPAADEQQQQEAEQRQGKGKETERGTVLPITWRRRKKKKNKTGKATDSRTSEGNISSSDRDGGSRGGDARDEEGEWQLPRLVDSLAIAYLACVLASVPIRIGDLTRWATNGELCFLAQTQKLPVEMRDQLPGNYRQMLRPYAFRGGELHKAVMDFAVFYGSLCRLKFPELSVPLILYQYVRDLALPIEVYPMARIISTTVGMGFRFPFETPPRKPIDDPETHLAALVVVITKLLFPFDGIPRVPDKATDPSALTMDWKVWQAEFTRQVKVEQSISEMTKEELDARVAQVIQGIGSRSSKNDDILQFFSQNGPESRPSTPGSAPEMRSASSINQSVQRILAAMDRAQTEAPDHRPGSHYEVYETEEDLPEVGRMFYAKCAEVAGLQLSTLIRSVVLVEKELAAWQKAQR